MFGYVKKVDKEHSPTMATGPVNIAFFLQMVHNTEERRFVNQSASPKVLKEKERLGFGLRRGAGRCSGAERCYDSFSIDINVPNMIPKESRTTITLVNPKLTDSTIRKQFKR